MFKFLRRRSASAGDQTAAPASHGGVPLDSVSPEDRARLEQIAADFNARPPAERGPFAEPDSDEYDLWKAGKLVPWAITHLLDAGGHVGPAVDIACGVQEPAVDLWEAGRLYPSWDETVALARLLNARVRILAHPAAQPRHHEDRPWRRVPGMAILSFEPSAVEAATTGSSSVVWEEEEWVELHPRPRPNLRPGTFTAADFRVTSPAPGTVGSSGDDMRTERIGD